MTKVTDMLFVGFNSRIAALDKHTGKKIWEWKAKKNGMMGYVGLFLEAERLYVCVDGYTTCLDALTGRERWHNPLKGMGTGAPSLAMSSGHANAPLPHFADEGNRRRTTAAGSGTAAHS